MARRSGFSTGGGSGSYGPWMSGPPTLSGTPQVGVVFTASLPATVTGEPTPTASWQWKANGSNVGTDSASYTPSTAGQTLTVTLTETNASGSTSQTSATSAVVIASGGGVQTASWQDMINATDNGTGTLAAVTYGWMRGRTVQTITGDGYFEAVPGSDRSGGTIIGLCAGLPTAPGTGADIQVDIAYQLQVDATGAYLYLPGGAGNAQVFGGQDLTTPVIGATYRMEISGTDLLIKRNGTTVITLASQTFAGSYYGYFRAYSDSSPDTLPSISASKILA
jgi:hypothetical protein